MMTGRLVVLVFALGCGGSSSEKEKKSCERAITLCGYDEGADSCIKDIQETREAMGESYGKFLDCSAAAKTCGEYVGCAVGGIGSEGMKQIDGLRKGMERMMGDKMRDIPKGMTGGDGAIAAECKRADDVCGPDDAERAADKCNDMMGNVKADPANRAKFASCLAAAKNCYAFKDCADQLWFDLN